MRRYTKSYVPKQQSSRMVFSVICKIVSGNAAPARGCAYSIQRVGNVAEHESGADIATIENPIASDGVLLLLRMVRTILGREHLAQGIDLITVDAAMLIDARLEAMWRCRSTLTSPSSRIRRVPAIGSLWYSQYM